jgi:hypothetical protein
MERITLFVAIVLPPDSALAVSRPRALQRARHGRNLHQVTGLGKYRSGAEQADGRLTRTIAMTQLNAVTGNQDDRGARARSVRFANSSPLRPGRRTSRISSGGRSLGPTIIVPFADGHPLHHLHQGAPPCGCFHRGPPFISRFPGALDAAQKRTWRSEKCRFCRKSRRAHRRYRQ